MPPTLAPVVLTIALASVAAPAAAAGHDDLLLSGYGNPGAAEQTLFGEALMPAGPPGGSGGGGTWLAAADASAGTPATATAPAASSDGTTSAAAPAGVRGSERDAAGRPGSGELADLPAIAPRQIPDVPASASAGLPIAPAAIALLAGLALTLGGIAVLARGRRLA